MVDLEAMAEAARSCDRGEVSRTRTQVGLGAGDPHADLAGPLAVLQAT